jgi:hypothetical protein
MPRSTSPHSADTSTDSPANTDSKLTLIAVLNEDGLEILFVSTGAITTAQISQGHDAFIASLMKSDLYSDAALADCREDLDPLSALQTLITQQIDGFDPETRAPWNTIEVTVVRDQAAMVHLAESLENPLSALRTLLTEQINNLDQAAMLKLADVMKGLVVRP